MRAALGLVLLAACGGPAKPGVVIAPAPDNAPPAVDPDPEIAALEAQLAGAKEPAAQASLHAQLGSLLWARSCPDAVFGLCIAKADVAAPARTTCASYQVDSVTSNVSSLARDAEHARRAVEHFEAALALDAGLGEPRLALIDRDFEVAFSSHFPTDLDFAADPSGSARRFDAWFTGTTETLGKANQAYLALATDPTVFAATPSVKFAAAYRMGALAQWFADQLFQAPVPINLQADEELYQAYCDTLFDKAEPLEAHALETFSGCVTGAKAAGVTGVWPDQCHAELLALDPTSKL